jgi:lipopolysaccharide export system protein LptC
MSFKQRLQRLLDRLTLYLPMLVMAVLAMGSWWLARSLPALWNGPTVKPVRKEPDYHLERFSTRTFDASGRLTRQLGGEKARHYPQGDELHIDNVTFDALAEQGVRVTASARTGVVMGDDHKVIFSGDVLAVRQGPGSGSRLELRGSRIVVLQKEEKLLSENPVEIRRGVDVITAETMTLDMKTGQYQLAGQVRGTLVPGPRP